MKKQISILLIFCMICSLVFTNIGVTNEIKANTKTANISVLVSYNYKLAQYILKYTNKERTKRGIPKLKMDKSLTKAAMKRACELSVHISETHKRPNGKDRASLNRKIQWENTIESYERWLIPNKTSNKKYKRIARELVGEWMSSEHHRPGILMRKYKSVGIGVCHSIPWLYASQEFSSSKAGKKCKNKKVGKYKYYKVQSLKKYLAKKYFQAGVMDDGDLNPGEKASAWILHLNPYFNKIKVEVSPKNFKFISSNPKVISINKKGILKAKKTGYSKIKIMFKATSKIIWKKKVKVQKEYEY